MMNEVAKAKERFGLSLPMRGEFSRHRREAGDGFEAVPEAAAEMKQRGSEGAK